MKTRVAIADDHRMLRDAIRAMLQNEDDIEIVGEAGDGHAAIEMAKKVQPDILILDISMPSLNGIESAARITARFPAMKLIALSGYTDQRYVMEMFKAGAMGYVVKAAAGSELINAIRAVARGENYVCPELAGAMVNAVLVKQANKEGNGEVSLGHREREVLQLIAEGMRTPAIAQRMSISPATVETHRRNIMRKLTLHSVADLTRYAIQHGITEL